MAQYLAQALRPSVQGGYPHYLVTEAPNTNVTTIEFFGESPEGELDTWKDMFLLAKRVSVTSQWYSVHGQYMKAKTVKGIVRE